MKSDDSEHAVETLYMGDVELKCQATASKRHNSMCGGRSASLCVALHHLRVLV
jgi:hypothetical protein